MFATLYHLASSSFCASLQARLSDSGLPSVAGSNYLAPNGGFYPRGRNRSCSFLAPFRSNSTFLALSQVIA
jgi:hypothetical protein